MEFEVNVFNGKGEKLSKEKSEKVEQFVKFLEELFEDDKGEKDERIKAFDRLMKASKELQIVQEEYAKTNQDQDSVESIIQRAEFVEKVVELTRNHMEEMKKLK